MSNNNLELVCSMMLSKFLVSYLHRDGHHDTVECNGMYSDLPEQVKIWSRMTWIRIIYIDTNYSYDGTVVPEIVIG